MQWMQLPLLAQCPPLCVAVCRGTLSCAVPGQVGAGRSAHIVFTRWWTSLPSPGVRRTFHHPGNVRVLEVKIYYFFWYMSDPWYAAADVQVRRVRMLSDAPIRVHEHLRGL